MEAHSRTKKSLADLKNELVDQVLEHFLAARGSSGLALFDHPSFAVLEIGSRKKLPSEFAFPARIPVFQELVESAIFPNCVSNLEAPCEGIDPADVGVQQVDRLVGLAADFGIEVQS